MRSHFSYSVNNHRGNWIRSLLIKNKKPLVRQLREVPEDQWEEWEQRYIRSALAIGFPLTNATPGGDGVKKHSPEALAKMLAANKGRIFSEEHKAKLRLALSNLPPRSAATRAKIGAAHRGMHHSQAVKDRLRKINLGKKHSQETCRKIALSNTGRVVSIESRQKSRLTQIGRKLSLETRLKMRKPKTEAHKLKLRLSHLGKTPSLETRNRLSLAVKAIWQRRKSSVPQGQLVFAMP